MGKDTVMSNTVSFLRAERGKYCMGVFTGFTLRAFTSYVHLLNAHANTDREHRQYLESAMRFVLSTLQETELPLAKLAIAGVADWSFVEPLWVRIAPAGSPIQDPVVPSWKRESVMA